MMEDPLLSLPPEERDRVYSARELVDLALDGHFCIREQIDRCIREVDAQLGAEGRERMSQLPALRAYATDEEIDTWEATLLRLRDEVSALVVQRQELREEAAGQLVLFRSAEDGAAEQTQAAS
jgi:hypothetical protein